MAWDKIKYGDPNSKGGWFNISKQDNPFSKGNIGGTLTGIGNSVLSATGPLISNAISGGLESTAGNTIDTVGNAIGDGIGMVHPLAGMAVKAGSKIIGGITNRAFGSKLNQNNINAVKANISSMRSSGNALSTSSSNADLLNNWGSVDLGFDFSNGYIGKDGWWSNKAKKTARNLRSQQNAARAYAQHALVTGANNVDATQDALVMANSRAFGGYLNGLNDMGAIEYDIMSDYLTSKKSQTENKNNMSNIYFGMENGLFATGGKLSSHGADWSTGSTHINEGGTHEENPNQGVPAGVDHQGVPNLVEEGEVIYNDYVYSNRIKIDDATKDKFKLSKKKDYTYADLAKKLEKEIEENPNDPISKRGYDAQMALLAQEQERQKTIIEAEKAKEVFTSLSPEEQVGIIQQAAQQKTMQEEAMQQEALAQAQPTMEDMALQQDVEAPVQEVNVNALGGNLFKDGGKKRNENFRYSPILGNLTALGLMAGEVGRPNHSKQKAAADIFDNVSLASYTPVGGHLTYTPMDIWYTQNRLDANARATDRAIANSSSPNKIAGLLASGYNSQIASGDLFRKALEYNDALKQQIAKHNLGIDTYNSGAASKTSQFNASASNAAKQAKASMLYNALTDELESDASWYQSLYGNIDNLFGNLGAIGKENVYWNQAKALAKDGYTNLGNSETGKYYGINAEGGKLKRKKSKRGLTC